MDKLLAIVTNPSVKRLFVFLLSLGTVALNKKFGLNLDAAEILGVVITALGFIGQSAAKEASLARSDALAAVAKSQSPSAPQ